MLVPMGSETDAPREPRGATDDSLQAERVSVDLAHAELSRSDDGKADDIVERERERADAVLETARALADRPAQPFVPAAASRLTVLDARAREDLELREERAAADARVDVERVEQRAEQARRLAALLPLERQRTDLDLWTERARSDEQLANRDDFLGMVSHDLRNLLCGLMLEASVLADGASDSSEGRRTVAGMGRIERYAARMNGLIGDLVDVVSIDGGKLAVRRKHQDAVPTLSEAVETFLGAAKEKGVSLRCDASSSTLPADFDSARILQVLANLLANALKFTPRGGRILLHAERTSNELRVCVSDTGIGIPTSQTEAVFERFWQEKPDEKRGFGLGLYISRCIVEAHAGKIWVESAPGQGSSFRFTVPDALALVA